MKVAKVRVRNHATGEEFYVSAEDVFPDMTYDTVSAVVRAGGFEADSELFESLREKRVD